ncbi:hypothetical protein Dimus_009788 [Dionaea muscipula]
MELPQVLAVRLFALDLGHLQRFVLLLDHTPFSSSSLSKPAIANFSTCQFDSIISLITSDSFNHWSGGGMHYHRFTLGNAAVIIGLWPAHFIWTYYCILKTKRLGIVLKILILILLPIPLILWPVIGILGSILGGIGYGFFTPLVATFEAVEDNIADKFFHCIADDNEPSLYTCSLGVLGNSDMPSLSPLSFGNSHMLFRLIPAVRDFVDFCFHSYFSYMDELSEKILVDKKPVDIKLLRVSGCFLIILLALPIDVISLTAVALWKSPYMLYRGWKRLIEDLLGREGPFLETFLFALYAGVIVHQIDNYSQEDDILMGLAYIVVVVSLFDEYVNDLLDLKEGSRLPSQAEIP